MGKRSRKNYNQRRNQSFFGKFLSLNELPPVKSKSYKPSWSDVGFESIALEVFGESLTYFCYNLKDEDDHTRQI